jgi:hypothetical protein
MAQHLTRRRVCCRSTGALGRPTPSSLNGAGTLVHGLPPPRSPSARPTASPGSFCPRPPGPPPQQSPRHTRPQRGPPQPQQRRQGPPGGGAARAPFLHAAAPAAAALHAARGVAPEVLCPKGRWLGPPASATRGLHLVPLSASNSPLSSSFPHPFLCWLPLPSLARRGSHASSSFPSSLSPFPPLSITNHRRATPPHVHAVPDRQSPFSSDRQ